MHIELTHMKRCIWPTIGLAILDKLCANNKRFLVNAGIIFWEVMDGHGLLSCLMNVINDIGNNEINTHNTAFPAFS